MENSQQGTISLIVGNKESVGALLNGETGKSMQESGISVVLYQGDILDDAKTPSLSSHPNLLPQGVIAVSVQPSEQSSS